MQNLITQAEEVDQGPSAQLSRTPGNHDAGLEHEADLTMTGLFVKQPSVTETPIQRQEGAEEKELVEEAQEEGATEEFQDSIEEAIAELLSYASESEVDAMLAGQPKEETDAGVQDDVTQALASSPAQLVKSQPKHKANYTSTTTHDGRTYYHKASKRNNRTKKFSGPIVYTNTARINTPKVRYKRKNDAAGHLIAHSFGGPPTFTGNFVAMNKIVNSAGGDWGKMETYIRKRLKKKSTAAYMSVTPKYADKNSQRPTSIIVTVHFNRAPKWKRWTIATP